MMGSSAINIKNLAGYKVTVVGSKENESTVQVRRLFLAFNNLLVQDETSNVTNCGRVSHLIGAGGSGEPRRYCIHVYPSAR